MNLLDFITVLILLIILALLVEKALHMSYSLKQVVYQLKKDIKSIVKYLMTPEIVRHTFDITLQDEFRNVVIPYKHEAFEIEFDSRLIQNVPTIRIRFVPKRKFDTEELIELSNLLLLKLRRYLCILNLKWNTFVDYRTDENYVYVNLHYAELEEDCKNIILLYNQSIRQKSDIDYGVLRDDELNKELKNVS